LFPEGKGDVFPDRQRVEERAVLEKHPGFLAQRDHLLLGQLGHVLVAKPDLPRIGLHQADDMLEQDALAAAAASDDDHVFTLANFQVDAAEHFLAAQFLLHADQADKGLKIDFQEVDTTEIRGWS
jgi:hypothetical protein